MSGTLASLPERLFGPACFLALFASAALSSAEDKPAGGPDFSGQVMPILEKYCTACHNDDDREGKLSLESFDAMQRGGQRGGVLLAGDSGLSRLVRVLTGAAKPKMPPAGSEAPSAEEVAVLEAWIDAGAKGPQGAEPDRRKLITPDIPAPENLAKPVTALAWSPDGKLVATARFAEVELRDAATLKPVRRLEKLPGKVNHLQFSSDGRSLITASGVAGLFGEAAIWNVADGKLVRKFIGHRDTLYAAVLSPEGKHLATAGYDRQIILWSTADGRQVRRFSEHNDAIYDLAFSPDGAVLASASGDETVKLWHVASGRRLDTLGQPLAEQYSVAFSPDGRRVVAGGADNRIRVWKFISRTQQKINPLLLARFAHEGPITHLDFNNGGKLVSVSQDGTIKLWETENFTELQLYEKQPEVPSALAISPRGDRFAVGRMDGSLQSYPLATARQPPKSAAVAVAQSDPGAPTAAPKNQAEAEPNDTPETANEVALPAIVSGTIFKPGEDQPDADLFRFRTTAGARWILETDAAGGGSQLDSKIEVLHADGRPVQRVLLQAVRDSYITFRGIDGNSRDVRLHNWEEMKLNQYVYANGEVFKLFLAPRGPDSGFQLYPFTGSRRTYFDTTAIAHALHEPCYVVEPHPPGTTLIPNGLPQFSIHYVNDDDSLRQLGRDSRLTFTAPTDGQYLVRVTDVRDFGGPKYQYKLTLRRPQPDFRVTLQGTNPTVGAGSGKEFSLVVDRIDGFDGEVQVDITGLPPGFSATTPLVVEQGHRLAKGTINALPHAPKPTDANASASKVTATAIVGRKKITKKVNNFGRIALDYRPRLLVRLSPPGEPHVSLGERKWTVLEPQSARSDGGAELKVEGDGSVIAAGKQPDKDTYTIVAPVPKGGVHSIRLETLGDKRLPGGGPGRAGNGNFAITGFSVTAAVANQPDRAKPIKLTSAESFYSQPNWPVSDMLDGKANTGWAVGYEDRDMTFKVKQLGGARDHTAYFKLEKPADWKPGTQLTLKIESQSPARQHNLGRFRISVTADPPPPLTAPKPPELVIAPGETITATLRVERSNFNQRVQFESLSLNLPHGVIIDNIGLNGVLIPEGQTERTIFLTAADWVPEQTRPFLLRANQEGQQTSWPMILHVRHPDQLAERSP